MTTLKGLTDKQIDLLIDGSAHHEGLDHLEQFLSRLRYEGRPTPAPAEAELVASRAAAVARSGSPTPIRLDDRRPGLWARVINQAAAAAAAVALMMGSAGVAYAANGSAPGDALYGLDIALESVGIGAGSYGERLEEVNTLAGRDDLLAAITLLQSIVGQLDGEGSAAVDAVTILIGEIDESPGGIPESVVEKVEMLLQFIDENARPGVGLDGREFGQGVAAIASGKAKGQADDPDASDAAIDDPSPDLDDPGADQGAPGNSENSNAGGNNQDNPPGNSENSNAGGNNQDNPPGNSENSNAGGNNQDNPPGNSENSNAGGNNQDNPPGNSENSNAGGNPKP